MASPDAFLEAATKGGVRALAARSPEALAAFRDVLRKAIAPIPATLRSSSPSPQSLLRKRSP